MKCNFEFFPGQPCKREQHADTIHVTIHDNAVGIVEEAAGVLNRWIYLKANALVNAPTHLHEAIKEVLCRATSAITDTTASTPTALSQ